MRHFHKAQTAVVERRQSVTLSIEHEKCVCWFAAVPVRAPGGSSFDSTRRTALTHCLFLLSCACIVRCFQNRDIPGPSPPPGLFWAVVLPVCTGLYCHCQTCYSTNSSPETLVLWLYRDDLPWLSWKKQIRLRLSSRLIARQIRTVTQTESCGRSRVHSC